MKNVLISLPFHFSVRNFVFTPVMECMGKYPDVRFILISPRQKDGDAIREQGYPNVIHELSVPPRNESEKYKADNRGFKKLLTRGFLLLARWFDQKYLYDSLTYRFNYINRFAALHLRKKMSKAQQELEKKFSNFSPAWVGQPFPGSRRLFRLLYDLRYRGIFPVKDDWIKRLFNTYKPDALLLSRLQFPTVLPLILNAKDHNVPIIGITQSWDQPTSKGPMPPGTNVYVVGSRIMRKNLMTYHGIPSSRIQVIGHSFSDNYLHPDFLYERKLFMQNIGLPPDTKLIVFCTNLMTLKAHEPSIARHISEKIKHKHYGSNCSLFIRTHPQDIGWEEDFLPLHDPPDVIVARASGFGYYAKKMSVSPWHDMKNLANLMKHADLVINTVGTITIDAAAFDTPVICLGFDGNRNPPANDRILLRYEWEHYKPVIESKGVWLVQSYDELDRAILSYLQKSSLHREGRETLRKDHLEPFDGRASKRLVELTVKVAEGQYPANTINGHWDHMGIISPKTLSKPVEPKKLK